MKKISYMALIFLSTLNYYFVHAQSKAFSISGKVISFEESLPLEGVSITIKGTTKSSGTQADGTFSINVAPEDKLLVFSLADYQTQEISISPDRQYDVVLRRKAIHETTAFAPFNNQPNHQPIIKNEPEKFKSITLIGYW